jgi:glycosyltransferase involved in cell wall biosynthesis
VKRIVFTVTNDLSYDQRMARICTALSEAGFHCTLVGRKRKNSLPLESTIYQQKRLNCLVDKGKLFYAEYNLRLFCSLLFARFDAICSIDLDTVLPGLTVARMKRRKHVFDAHELFTEVPEVKDRKAVKKVWEWVQKLAFQKTDSAYTVGGALAEYFQEKYHRPVSVVRNIPANNATSDYQPDPEKFILYQGALNEGRGLEALLQAMQQLPCKLVLAGEGDLSEKLRALAKQLRVSHKVNFMGFVKPADLKKFTSKAWIGMNVSENAGLSYFLSLNNKFFDYLHAGLPSLINPFPEYIALNKQFSVGVITSPVVSDIVKNALSLLNDETLHAHLSANCQAAALELNWEAEKNRLTEIYKTLLD